MTWLKDSNVKRGGVDIEKEFNKHTKYKHGKYGHSIDCKKGLWGVTAPTQDQALTEAIHYFKQYFLDGEYNETTRSQKTDSI